MTTLVGKLVKYKNEVYQVVYDYGNGYLEIKEQGTYPKIELVNKKDISELEE